MMRLLHVSDHSTDVNKMTILISLFIFNGQFSLQYLNAICFYFFYTFWIGIFSDSHVMRVV
jgi:hypothetical protein